MRILPWYILRQHLVPFLLGFGVVTFIFEMDALFQYLDLVINRGVPALVVLKLFALSLGFVVPMSAPSAVLVAELMTFGRLSQDNEITALRASGIHLFRAITPSLLAAIVLAVLLTLFNNHVYPEANHAFANLLVDIGRMRPTVKLQEGVFITDFPGYNLLVQRVNGRTNEMQGVTIYQMNAGQSPRTILAKTGFLRYTADGRTAVLELKEGEIHEIISDAQGPRRYHRLAFHRHLIYIQGAGSLLEHTVRDSRGDREKSARMLMDERQEVVRQYDRSLSERVHRFLAGGATAEEVMALAPDRAPWTKKLPLAMTALVHGGDPLAPVLAKHPALAQEAQLWKIERDGLRRTMAGFEVEIHKKFALPAACVVFVFIGAPIGMRVRRAGPAVAFLSIGFFLFYYVCLVGGEELANRLLVPSWLGIWIANIVLGLIGIDQTCRACDVHLPWHGQQSYARRVRGGDAPAPREAAA